MIGIIHLLMTIQHTFSALHTLLEQSYSHSFSTSLAHTIHKLWRPAGQTAWTSRSRLGSPTTFPSRIRTSRRSHCEHRLRSRWRRRCRLHSKTGAGHPSQLRGGKIPRCQRSRHRQTTCDLQTGWQRKVHENYRKTMMRCFLWTHFKLDWIPSYILELSNIESQNKSTCNWSTKW